MCVRMLFFLGSHDSGANQDLDTKLPVANDEPNSIRVLGIAPCVKSGIKRWAVTQSYSIREQLDNGIRYLDLRVSYPPQNTRADDADFRLVHALYGITLRKGLEEVIGFLEENKKEVVILDVNHVFDFEEETFKTLEKEAVKTLGEARMCPFPQVRPVTLDFMWINCYSVIIFSPRTQPGASPMWPRCLISSPWPNTSNIDVLLRTLQSDLESRTGDGMNAFFVSQGVCTPQNKDVFRHWFSSLRNSFSIHCTKEVLQWLSDLSDENKEKVNIVILDFVNEESSQAVISLNTTSIRK